MTVSPPSLIRVTPLPVIRAILMDRHTEAAVVLTAALAVMVEWAATMAALMVA
jgi:hypothetical protein